MNVTQISGARRRRASSFPSLTTNTFRLTIADLNAFRKQRWISNDLLVLGALTILNPYKDKPVEFMPHWLQQQLGEAWKDGIMPARSWRHAIKNLESGGFIEIEAHDRRTGRMLISVHRDNPLLSALAATHCQEGGNATAGSGNALPFGEADAPPQEASGPRQTVLFSTVKETEPTAVVAGESNPEPEGGNKRDEQLRRFLEQTGVASEPLIREILRDIGTEAPNLLKKLRSVDRDTAREALMALAEQGVVGSGGTVRRPGRYLFSAVSKGFKANTKASSVASAPPHTGGRPNQSFADWVDTQRRAGTVLGSYRGSSEGEYIVILADNTHLPLEKAKQRIAAMDRTENDSGVTAENAEALGRKVS
jgi:hypothetical protein